MNKIKILIEIPGNWLDTDLTGNLDWVTQTVRQEISKQIKIHVISKVLESTEIPEVIIKPQEIKDRMVTIIAERALEKNSM